MRLVGTTKTTLQAIRDRTHWNSSTLTPMDPVTLALCTQIDLDFEVNKAAKDRPATAEDRGQTLAPAETTTARARPATRGGSLRSSTKTHQDDEDDVDLTSVFSNLRGGRHARRSEDA